jgi:uncharacterized membrane protein YgcG
MGYKRTAPLTKLRSFQSMWKGTSPTKASLKVTALSDAAFVSLINCKKGDFDTWLPARPELMERHLQLFFQRILIDGSVDAALVHCRDKMRDSIAASPDLAPVYGRIKKARTSDPDKDMLEMYFLIDQHCVKSGAAMIAISIESRRFEIGSETIASYFESLINLCKGHLDDNVVRTKFIVAVTTTLDDAAKAGTYPISLINDVRDNVLNAEGTLPEDNDDLRQHLEKRSSTNSVWDSLSAPTPSRSPKEARANLADPIIAPPTHSPPPPQQPAPIPPPVSPNIQYQPPPPQQPPPATPPTYYPTQHQQHDSPNEAETYYGAPGGGYGGGYQGRGGGGFKGGSGGGYNGGRGGGYQSGGGGKGFGGKGKGGFPPKDPSAATRFYNWPYIISTGKVVPKDTPLRWNNPKRINADGSGDGLYGVDCPLCGKDKNVEMTWDEFVAQKGAPPGNGPDKVRQPPGLSILHRALGCREGGWQIQNWIRDHPDDPDAVKFNAYMTEGELEAFKSS